MPVHRVWAKTTHIPGGSQSACFLLRWRRGGSGAAAREGDGSSVGRCPGLRERVSGERQIAGGGEGAALRHGKGTAVVWDAVRNVWERVSGERKMADGGEGAALRHGKGSALVLVIRK